MPAPAPGPAIAHGLHRAAPDTSALESALMGVEQAIATLGMTLTRQDANAIEAAAGELQAAMRAALEHFAQVARGGIMPPALRKRFAMASGQVAAQREALFRATNALDQALDILIPKAPSAASVYSAQGNSGRGPGQMIAAS